MSFLMRGGPLNEGSRPSHPCEALRGEANSDIFPLLSHSA
jgi:hypothetical protein